MSLLPMLAEMGGSIIGSLLQGIVDNLSTIVGAVSAIIDTLIGFIIDNLDSIIDAGMNILETLLIGIINALPELARGAVDLLTRLVEFIADNIDLIVNAAVDIVLALVDGLIDNLPLLITAAGEIISGVVLGLIQRLPDLLDAGGQLIGALLQGVQQALVAVYKVFEDLYNYIVGIFNQSLDKYNAIVDMGKESDRLKALQGIEAPDNGVFAWTKSYGYASTLNLQTNLEVTPKFTLTEDFKSTISDANKYAEESFNGLHSEVAKASTEIGAFGDALAGAGAKAGSGAKSAAKKATDETKEAEEAIKKSFAFSKTWIEQQVLNGDLTREQQVEAWKRVAERYDEYTDQHMDAQKEIQKLEKEIASESEKLAKEQIKADEEALKQFKADRDERMKIAKALYDDESKRIENLTKDKKLSYKEQLEAWRDLQESFDLDSEFSADAEQKILDVRRSITEELINLQESYNKSLDSTREKIFQSYGLFDEVANNDENAIKGSDLAKNLQDQIKSLNEWADNIAVIAARNVDGELIAMLRDMGVKSSAEVKALAQMSTTEFNSYNELFKQKREIAEKAAIAQLEETKKTLEAKTAELNEALAYDDERLSIQMGVTVDFSAMEVSNKEALDAFYSSQDGWKKAGEELDETLSDALEDNKIVVVNSADKVGSDAGKAVSSAISKQSTAIRSSAYDTGKSLVDGLEAGIRNEAYRAVQAAEDLARQVAEALNDTLEVRSPSKLAWRTGAFLAEGLSFGMIDNIDVVQKAAEKLGLASVPSSSLISPEKQSGGLTGSGSVVINIDNHITVKNLDELPYKLDRANQRAIRGLNGVAYAL
jgi:hypothetical protein